MASAAERFHIVLSSDERRTWNARASSLGVPTAEYVRRAVAAFEAGLTPDELEQLSTLSDAVGEAATRMHDAIDRAVSHIDRPIDETAMRARVRQRLDHDAFHIDPRLLDFGGAHAA